MRIQTKLPTGRHFNGIKAGHVENQRCVLGIGDALPLTCWDCQPEFDSPEGGFEKEHLHILE